jgi:hypothetical protein
MGRAIGVFNGNSRHNRIDPGYDSTPLPAHLQASMEQFKNACEVLRLAGYQPAEFATGTYAEREAAIIKKAGELLDADLRTIESASVRALKQAAGECNCMACNSMLYSIDSSLRDYAHCNTAYGPKWARQNRCYYIKQLREALASRTVKHSGR